MTERPILFSAPMVRALLDGTKTQTRRVVKFAEVLDFEKGADGSWHVRTAGGITRVRCPYGVPGDLLWVRENFSAEELDNGNDGLRYPADKAWMPIDGTAEAAERWVHVFHYDQKRRPRGSEIPSIHMPRWASRLTLQITDVRLERLNDCSEDDALAEGVCWSDQWQAFVVPGVEHPNKDFPVLSRATAREMYAALWDTINGSGEWLANPWVWAVSFEVVR